MKGLGEVVAEHPRGDWSDRTHSCGGCADRFEESIQEQWENSTDDERRALRTELHKHMKPGWSMADYNAHVEAAVLDWIRERLAGAREDVLTAVAESVRETNYLGDQAEPDEITEAAIAAVAEALGVGEVRG